MGGGLDLPGLGPVLTLTREVQGGVRSAPATMQAESEEWVASGQNQGAVFEGRIITSNCERVFHGTQQETLSH